MRPLWLLAPLALAQAACSSWYRVGPEVRTVDQRLAVGGKATIEGGLMQVLFPVSLSSGVATDDGSAVVSLESGFDVLGESEPVNYVVGPRFGGVLAGPTGTMLGMNGGPLLDLDPEASGATTVLSLELFAGVGTSGDVSGSFTGGATLSVGWLEVGHFRVPSGRALRRGDRIVVAPVVADASWLDPCAIDVDLPSARRDALGREWLRQALDEHASIAAFVELERDLRALSAPAALVHAAACAALDERRHARHCFTIASAYLGAPLGPGPLPPPAPRKPCLARLAREALVDGWVGEGMAAQVAAARAAREPDPTVRRVLRAIAWDEARHAWLGRHTLSWCRSIGGPPVKWAIADALDRVAA